MRRILSLLLCCLLFVLPVSAANFAPSVQSTATVNADGSCQITINMTIRLEQPVTELTLPLAADVSDVRLNGSRAKTERTGSVTGVKLDNVVRDMVGQVPITVSFTVKNVVTTDEDGRQSVTVPLLQGLPYPVEEMSFSVTMPGSFDAVPTFLSGYYHQDIESSLTYRISGVTISGTVDAELKDHETLAMTLAAPEGMFPQERVLGGTLMLVAMVMGACGALAAVYWLTTMRCRPRFPIRFSTAPEGITAGTVGSYLVHTGAELSQMVMTWAQLGYLIIHLDPSGAILLHKRMEMGNERSAFEQKTFRKLFGKRNTIDATGTRFAALGEKTSQLSARMAWGLEPGSGNPKFLGLLGTVIGAFAGIALADCLVGDEVWRSVLMVALGIAAAIASLFIRKGMRCLHLKEKKNLWIGLICAGVLIVPGMIAGCAAHVAAAVVLNAVFGLMAAYTGKRSETGNQIRDQLFGLRRYMCKATRPDLERILLSNPDYYYELAPYALALGVDKKFAKRFGDTPLRECSWFITGARGGTTAESWYLLLRAAAEDMTAIQNRPFWEKRKLR